MNAKEERLKCEMLRRILFYNKLTGNFTWIGKRRRVKEGKIAGRINQKGYRQIGTGGSLYQAHRLAWLWMTGEWPKTQIDHINMNRSDNRWANLREATREQNMANSQVSLANTSGKKGVYWETRRRKWRAQLRVGAESKFLGHFNTIEEASKIYNEAAKTAFGSEFVRT